MLGECIIFSFFRFFRDEHVQPAFGGEAGHPYERNEKTKGVRVTASHGNEINEVNEKRTAARRWSVGEPGRETGLLPREG